MPSHRRSHPYHDVRPSTSHQSLPCPAAAEIAAALPNTEGWSPDRDGRGTPERSAPMVRSERGSWPQRRRHRPSPEGTKQQPVTGRRAKHLQMVETHVDTTPRAVNFEADTPVTLKAVTKVLATSLVLAVCVFFFCISCLCLMDPITSCLWLMTARIE